MRLSKQLLQASAKAWAQEALQCRGNGRREQLGKGGKSSPHKVTSAAKKKGPTKRKSKHSPVKPTRPRHKCSARKSKEVLAAASELRGNDLPLVERAAR